MDESTAPAVLSTAAAAIQAGAPRHAEEEAEAAPGPAPTTASSASAPAAATEYESGDEDGADADGEAAAGAVAAVPDSDVTEEGKTATALDPALELRLKRTARLVEEGHELDEAADELGHLMKEASDRYGQLCPLLAPIYFAYGKALLRIVQRRSDALGGDSGPGATLVDKGDDEEEEEEAAGSSSGGNKDAGAAAEEDLDKEAEDGEKEDDIQIAFECLDSARIIYARMTPKTQENELELARVHVLLGDVQSENERFSDALHEYKTALSLRSQYNLLPQDKRIYEVLDALGMCNMQLASDKDVQEADRRRYLSQTLINFQASAESLCMRACDAARQAGHTAFVEALEAEVEAGALTQKYPAGLVTTVIGGLAGEPAPSPSSSSSSAASPQSKPAEPEIRVFRTLARTHIPASDLPAASSCSSSAPSAPPPAAGSSSPASSSSPAPKQGASADDVPNLCDLIDALLQRMADIQDDLGISVSRLLSEVSAASGAGGVTTNGFGAPASAPGAGASSAPGAPSSSSSASAAAEGAGPATTLMARRKPATAAAPVTSAAAVPAAADELMPGASAAAAPLAGVKRARDAADSQPAGDGPADAGEAAGTEGPANAKAPRTASGGPSSGWLSSGLGLQQ